ncbi:MAG TPA: hypothetical protein VNE71_16590 [Myxococcota bacterium]|nr:hypothetical protein [Myxococcota bacterium]
MSDSDSVAHEPEEVPKGKVDLVAVLYILGGIPAIVAYIVICFVLARFFNFPA